MKNKKIKLEDIDFESYTLKNIFMLIDSSLAIAEVDNREMRKKIETLEKNNKLVNEEKVAWRDQAYEWKKENGSETPNYIIDSTDKFSIGERVSKE